MNFEQTDRLQGVHAVVWGLGRSGLASAKLLADAGAHVTLCDAKPRQAMGESTLAELEQLQAACLFEQDQLPAGAQLLVLSPGVPLHIPPVVQAARQKIPVIGELELAWWFNRCKHVAAITGTNGKTTTTALLHNIFSLMPGKAYAAGNIGLPWTAVVQQIQPEDWVALEVSSFQLETVAGFKPNVSMILNLTPDHMDRHKTMQQYAAAKARIFENQTGGDDVFVYRAEDAQIASLAQLAKCRVLPFSRLRVLQEGVCVKKGMVVYNHDNHTCPVCPLEAIGIPGAHNVENVLAATAAAIAVGVPVEVIRRGIESFSGVEHRLEFVAEINGVQYINDSKGTNPDSTIKAIEAATRPTVLIAGGYDKKTPFFEMAQLIAARDLQDVVVMGDTAGQIVQALRRVGYNRVHVTHTMLEAAEKAAELARPGGQVLLSPACASYDQFANFEQRGQVFKQWVMQRKAEAEG